MIILITGTSKGLGRGLAEYFLARGQVVAGCSRGAATIKHASYEHHTLDVADEKAVVKMVRAVARRHGRIDALLNNAGIASMNPVALTPAKSARTIMETNFLGTFLFCREVAKIMQRQTEDGGRRADDRGRMTEDGEQRTEGGERTVSRFLRTQEAGNSPRFSRGENAEEAGPRSVGRIVNFSSVAEPLRLEGEAVYAASKAAIESLTRILARELGASGVTVNAVGPSPVPTDLVAGVPREKMDALLARQAIARWGTIDDVANVVEFFLGERSGFVTGQVIYLGGVG